jgi:hypothetical protein
MYFLPSKWQLPPLAFTNDFRMGVLKKVEEKNDHFTGNDVSFLQHAVIVMFVKKNSTSNIFNQVCHICGNSFMDANSIQHWTQY